ncbi:pleckstrin-likey (PH) domain-containing protein [Quillaja saponaria]|uniref:Pleckstrin-likey (PH) domain-containing protein n=1 Tax=Quillaja saponaria TaxID=32244 RepID=A0AAD7P7J3_QUISA|nr:pleckstrin-likey (PH) domain-containing protein [Quillaja saponaria]
MLEDQVAYLLQKYLGNYVRGLNKEALKISVWQGDVELKNMQLKPEALNALKLPVKVKAGFLGSVKLKVPWSRLGQDPVLVYLDRIFLLAEPATQVEGCTEDAVQEAKKNRVREMELKLLEKSQQLKSEMNKSWLGSLISTIVGNLKLSISNIHIRYEDFESNPGHPFAAGITLEKLSAVTVDDSGKEAFVTEGGLDRIQKSVELDQLAVYLDSNIVPWRVDKSWEDLLPSEWFQVFKFGTKDGKPADYLLNKHSYMLQPKALVNLDDVTLCLSKDGYRDMMKLADNFDAFNKRLKYAHYRPLVSLKSDPRSWWKYSYRAVSEQMKKASGKMSWEQVLKYASLRKRYVSLYASLLKSDLNQVVVDDNKDIEELDRELDIELILQWRMLAHKFVEQSTDLDLNTEETESKKVLVVIWMVNRPVNLLKDDSESFQFTEEDWIRLNKIIGYKEEDDGQSLTSTKGDALNTSLEIHMNHNASKLVGEAQDFVAELSCEDLNCSIKLYPETKLFNVKLGSYQLSSPNGLLAESATTYDSLVGVFSYKPFDYKVDWSLVAKASPCYMTYLKDTVDQIINFFESNTAVSQTIALETAAAMQMTIDGVKRTAQQQVNRALKDHTKFLLDLDIAAPKITIPTDFCPDHTHSTKLLLDLGNLIIRTQDDNKHESVEENMYLQFDLVLSDVSAFLFDGDYHWSQSPWSNSYPANVSFLPIVDKCGVILQLQQIRVENPVYPCTRLAVRLPSLGFHFSPARYHRLMQVVKMFEGVDSESSELLRPWNQADFEGWLSLLTWKGVGNREAVWQRRYICLVGPFLYVLESPGSKSYKQYLSLLGKQIYQVPPEYMGNEDHILAVCSPMRSNKVVEDANALILRCDSDDSRKTWQSRLQGAIYRASDSIPITGLSETSSDADSSDRELGEVSGITTLTMMEKLFVTGALDELKVCFSYSSQCESSFMKVLLARERHLFEFRAIGGQVEISIRENEMLIGTVLKSLEIEDLVCYGQISQPCYLARSFIGSGDGHSSFCDSKSQCVESSDRVSSEADDKFYEAPETLVDASDYSMQSHGSTSERHSSSPYLSQSNFISLKPPNFDRTSGLLPDDTLPASTEDIELVDTLDSFVKAQIIICDHNSPRYNSTDKQVIVTLATLSFFCRRPTVLAIMEFVNAINIDDGNCESFSESSSTAMVKHDGTRDVVDDLLSTSNEESAIKGLLGKGKTRIMFNLMLKMARAQIFLMTEDETKLASLSQENLLTDIKVFPSSFSIKAALGNLRIGDDSLPSSHIYYWICDMRNPGGSSIVELVFTSFSVDDEDYKGYDYSLSGELSEVRIVYLNRFIQEVVSYFMALVPNNSKGFVKLKDQVTNSEKWISASEIQGSPAVKLDLSLWKPIILMPRRTDSLDFLKLDIVHITVQNTFQWISGSKSDINAVHLETLTVQVEDINLNVGTGTEIGESIIQDVNGVSVVICRSLRDLFHKVPSTEALIKIGELKAALSNMEYQIITECALSNISEMPHILPPLNQDPATPSIDSVGVTVAHDVNGIDSNTTLDGAWIVLKVSVIINLVELCLHTGVNRDASLATLQVSGAWLLYKTNTLGDGFLSATLKDFSVIDDRQGVEQEFRLAIGKPGNVGTGPLCTLTYDQNQSQGSDLSEPSTEAVIYVGSGKTLQFKNVVIKNGQYLDSCISLGSNSSYSASNDDQVYIEGRHEASRPSEFIIDLQAIGPELAFYNAPKDAGESSVLSNKLLHVQLDAFCRLVLKGDITEITADVLGLTMESTGIRILEPFDTSVKYLNASGKTHIHLSVSDIFMNFTFSILRLFLAVEDDILAFLRMTSKKMTVVCSHFDKVGTIRNSYTDQTYAFWRPHAPPGFAVLGDYLTPLDKPPTKGVLAVNTSSTRVKKPINFRLIWPSLASGDVIAQGVENRDSFQNAVLEGGGDCCSIWYPEAPKGYVALGCVVSHCRAPPPLSSAFCILASLVSPCSLRDCITIGTTDICPSSLAFWRVENSVGTFLPADAATCRLMGKAYELRHIKYGSPKISLTTAKSSDVQNPSGGNQILQADRSADVNSARRFEAVASFQLIWWNQGANSGKRLSMWRPVVPQGRIYFGDIAVKGYEPPNTSVVLHDTGDDLLRVPIDFQLVGQIKKQRGMESISFWLPQAPPGFVSLGCVACKGTPKQHEFSTLRCIRSDMGPLLSVAGFKKPPRRFALKLADSNIASGSDDTVIDAEIRTFSAALFDDYGGLTVPLFNVSLSGIGFSLHGRTEYLNSTVSFSLAARSYNDKYETWEPLVEPVDGFLRYQYDLNSPGAASQLRLTSPRDLNLNVSVSNANMIIQAYASWNNLSNAHDYYKNNDAFSTTDGGRSIIGAHHKRNYYIIPQNKLGQDIFIRATEVRGLQDIIRMPSGDMKTLKVPVSKNMLDSHAGSKLFRKIRMMVSIIIADAELPRVEGLTSHQYTVAIRLTPHQSLHNETSLHQQRARTFDALDHYLLELIVSDMGKGDPIGFFSAPLDQMAISIQEADSYPHNLSTELNWINLSTEKPTEEYCEELCGKVRCAVLVSQRSEVEDDSGSSNDDGHKSGFIQISPGKEGPWTTVRLNYAAPAACWRLGNDVVASEVSVKDCNRYVNIRSLVSVRNNTDFGLELCLVSRIFLKKMQNNSNNAEVPPVNSNRVQEDELFETEKYNPTIGWVSCFIRPSKDVSEGGSSHQSLSGVELPLGWEWVDDWHLDNISTKTADGWIYAPDVESLKWPESFDPLKSVNYARQRRWLRSRKQISGDHLREVSIGLLRPGETAPLPLSGLTQSGSYVLQLRPWNDGAHNEYSWSSVVARPGQADADREKDCSEMCVSALRESEELLCCTELSGSSRGSQKLWFCVSIQATELAKDIHSDPIQDWCLVVKSPLSISNFLPLAAEYSLLEMQESGHFLACSRGIFFPGKNVHIYSADIRKPLFFSLLPQRGWLPMHEAVLISHPDGVPPKTIGLRSSISGRIVQIILEQNYDKERLVLAKTIRVYAPYWLVVARCPPLAYRILDMAGKRHTRKIGARFQSKEKNEVILEEITEEEIFEGHTIASALNFNLLALSVAIAQTGKEHFGPVKDLSPLGDMDGSMDIYAHNADGKCMRLFVSTKPCPYQSVPTKVISVRPYMTFTNRLGQNLFIKFSNEDEPKVLRASDSRISFVYREAGGAEKLQVRLEDTNWSFPVQIVKEDTISLVLRRQNGAPKFLRAEIRGYEEGSRFIVVFRLGSTDGPIRIENRTSSEAISIRQSGFGEDAWIQLQPLSATNFSWEDPYGQKFIDAKVDSDQRSAICRLELGQTGSYTADEGEFGLQFLVMEVGDIKVAKFTRISMPSCSSNTEIWAPTLVGNWEVSGIQSEVQTSATPFELLIELGMVGISVVDHKPKELSYLYLERVFLSYSTGYDGGRTSRFKLILGYLQLDNQLPLTLMPVLLAPEQNSNMQHPVFKMTVTMQNENKDGVLVYPYVYIRVTEKCWRLNIHEPIIWAFVDFYRNLQLDHVPQSSSVTEVDPEIRFDLIDVSEVRLKLSLETAPSQRPHGVLGIWSPILSAVGNAFKIQVHLRRVMHKDRFMRKSYIVPAVGSRIWRDLIHNPLHLIFSVDVLGMTSSTLSSLSKGFAELSTDGQFLQLRSKQVRSRRITGMGDGIIQGTEAFAQGVAFGVSGVVTKPVESARQNGLLGLAHGLGRAFLGFIVQPVSGALDFFSLTVDGIGASCSKCLEVFNSKTNFQRIRNPRVIRADGVLREYCEREAVGQMVLYLAEAIKESCCSSVWHQKRMDKKPCKIIWDVPWEELMAVELAKAGCSQPSHLILHLKHFKKSENFVRVIKCSIEEDLGGRESQAVKICSTVRRRWKAYQSDMKSLILKVPSSQRHVYFAWSEADGRELCTPNKAILNSRELSAHSSASDESRFVKHSINFSKIWSSEQESKGRCSLCRKQDSDDGGICSIWRPVCPDGYVCIGDIAHVGTHPPNVAAVYRNIDRCFALPMGYDLVWRNCLDDYITPVSIWHPRAPDGYVSPGCVAVAGYIEPEPNQVYCVAESLVEETEFEDQKVWSAPDSYPWSCHIYQVQSDALHFVALRQTTEESEWRPLRILDDPHLFAIMILRHMLLR